MDSEAFAEFLLWISAENLADTFGEASPFALIEQGRSLRKMTLGRQRGSSTMSMPLVY